MIKKVFIIIGIIQMSYSQIYSSVEKITYRRWNNCYKISNDSIEVIVNPEAGGRILRFALHGEDMIYEDSTQNGKLYSDFIKEGFDPDGGRFDYGPEIITNDLHALTWMGEWSTKITGKFSIVLTSQLDYKLGVQTIREFKLDSVKACLSIKQTMTNISSDMSVWYFWGRTLVPIGGKLVVPLNPQSQYPQGWGKWDWSVKGGIVRSSNIVDPIVKTKENMLLFIPTTSSPRGKYGTDSHEGWMAYGYKDVLFVKRFEFFPDKFYSEKPGQIIIFFTNGKFTEMEPISPEAVLAPGESYSFTECWWLLPYQTSNIRLESLHDVSKFIIDKTKVYN